MAHFINNQIFFYFIVSKMCFQIYFYVNKFVLIGTPFLAKSSIICCLCFPPCAVAKLAVVHVSQTIRQGWPTVAHCAKFGALHV